MTDAMTSRERIVAALSGKPVDRLPFCPFLAYYWDSLPQQVRERGLLAFLHEIGADPLWRGAEWGAPCPVTQSIDGVEYRSHRSDLVTITETITPVGVLRQTQKLAPGANTTFMVEWLLRTKADFEVQLWIEEHTRIEWADQGPVREAVEREGLALGMLTPRRTSAFQTLVMRLAGTENLTYALADFPQTVEALLEAMIEHDLDAVRMAAESEYEYFLTWENSSTQNYSPAMYARYIAPELRQWCEILGRSGKGYVQHACGHVRDLVGMMKESGAAAVESLATPPTGNITLREARGIAGADMGIVGGIEPTHLLNLPLEKLGPYVEQVIEDGGGGPFVLANSDSCPPGVTVEKFKLISEIAARG